MNQHTSAIKISAIPRALDALSDELDMLEKTVMCIGEKTECVRIPCPRPTDPKNTAGIPSESIMASRINRSAERIREYRETLDHYIVEFEL